MSVEFKYFKIVDKETGKVSKEVGYIYTRELRDFAAKTINGERQVIKDELVTKVVEYLPPAELGAEEITEAEFDALTVHEDSANKTRRDKKIKWLKQLNDRFKDKKGNERAAARRAAVIFNKAERLLKSEK